jgi:hypothetical protein
LFAFLDALDRIGDSVNQHLIANGTPGHVESVDERNAGSQQRAKHPTKPGHGELGDQIAHHRRVQNQSFPRSPALLRDQPVRTI